VEYKSAPTNNRIALNWTSSGNYASLHQNIWWDQGQSQGQGLNITLNDAV